MNLNRLRQLAGIGKLGEELEVAPQGSESDMQVASTSAVDSGDSTFDDAQPNLTETDNELSSWQKDAIATLLISNLKKHAHSDVAIQNTIDSLYAGGVISSKNIPATKEFIEDYLDDELILNAGDERSWQDIGSEFDPKLDEKAPPGMEDMVMKLKKQYPGDEGKAFATAWSIYNKKHKKTDESVPAVDSCNQRNPASADVACAMEEGLFGFRPKANPKQLEYAIRNLISAMQEPGANIEQELKTMAKMYDIPPNILVKEWKKHLSSIGMRESGMNTESYVNYAIDKLLRLSDMFVEMDKAFEIVALDLQEQGLDRDTIDGILTMAEEKLFDKEDVDTDDSMDGDFDSAMASAGHGSDEDYGDFPIDETSAIRKNADILKIEKLVYNQGYKDGEIALETGNVSGVYNLDKALELWYAYQDVHNIGPDEGEMSDRIESAYDRGFRSGYGEISEAYDLNNGYNDRHTANKDDYFPDGADGPVVDATGSSGARQGDNPEQKKVQIQEVHKELVYNYRKFLKESDQKKKLTENNIQVIPVQHLYAISDNKPVFDTIYTATDGNGNYPLLSDGSVFFNTKDNPHIKEIDGKPHSTSEEEFAFIVNGKLGIYDNNFNLIRSYNSMGDFFYDLENGELPYLAIDID